MGRCLITGIGTESALGNAAQVLAALGSGRSALSMHQLRGVEGFPEVPGAPVARCRPVEYLPDRKLLKYMSPATAMALMAAGRALDHAGLRGDRRRLDRTALFVAAGLIAFDVSSVDRALRATRMDDGELDMAFMGGQGFRLCHPLMPFKMLLNMPLGMVSIALGLRGQNAIFYPGVDQAAACLEVALRGIRRGRFERALVGATANPVSLLPLCTLARQGRLARSVEAAAPYSEEHQGWAPADAAAFVLLESEEAARRRGARALAQLHAVALRRSHELAPAARYAARAELWREVCGDHPPRVLQSVGNLDARDDAAEQRSIQQTWGAAGPPLTNASSFDAQLGFQETAALPFALALLAPGRRRRRVLLSAGDPDGGHGVALLEPCGAQS